MMSEAVMCEDTSREFTIDEYLKMLIDRPTEKCSLDDFKRVCARCIELHEHEQKFRDDQLMDAREECEEAYQLNRAYRTVLADMIRYGCRWC